MIPKCMQSTVFMDKLVDSVIIIFVSLQNIIWMEYSKVQEYLYKWFQFPKFFLLLISYHLYKSWSWFSHFGCLFVYHSLFSRDTCTATVKPSRRWTVAPSVRHPQLVVRRFPKPLPSPSHRKPLTSTCVSSPSGWQRELWSWDQCFKSNIQGMR